MQGMKGSKRNPVIVYSKRREIDLYIVSARLPKELYDYIYERSLREEKGMSRILEDIVREVMDDDYLSKVIKYKDLSSAS